MEWLARIGEIAKVPTKFTAVVAIVTGLLLFLPENLTQYLYLSQLKESFSTYISIAFLFSVGILLVEAALALYSFVRDKNRLRKKAKSEREKIANRMNSLDSAEQSVIREFLTKGHNTLKLPIGEPTVARLIHDGILYQVGEQGEKSRIGMLLPLAITEAAEELITFEVTGLSEYRIKDDEGNTVISEKGKAWSLENRPSYIRIVESDHTF